MSDTIQVVHVESITGPWTENGEMVMRVRLRGADRSHSVPVGDVIELTERMIGQGDPVWPAKFYISEPVPVDD